MSIFQSGTSKGHRKNHRKYPGNKMPRPDLAKIRKAEADERQVAYDQLSIKEKLALLDVKLGDGVGAKKQRAQFAKKLEAKVAPAIDNTKELVAPNAAEVAEFLAQENAKEEKKQKKLKAKDRRKQQKHSENFDD